MAQKYLPSTSEDSSFVEDIQNHKPVAMFTDPNEQKNPEIVNGYVSMQPVAMFTDPNEQKNPEIVNGYVSMQPVAMFTDPNEQKNPEIVNGYVSMQSMATIDEEVETDLSKLSLYNQEEDAQSLRSVPESYSPTERNEFLSDYHFILCERLEDWRVSSRRHGFSGSSRIRAERKRQANKGDRPQEKQTEGSCSSPALVLPQQMEKERFVNDWLDNLILNNAYLHGVECLECVLGPRVAYLGNRRVRGSIPDLDELQHWV